MTVGLDIDNRFDHHPPKDDATVKHHETVRATVKTCAIALVAETPNGREQSLMLTHLEEALFWANAAIARDPR